jgi:hypothetical protein
MTPSSFADLEGFDSHDSRKKRLGQYFSGARVSKLLVALASQRVVRSAVDPMGGRGDMLSAAISGIGSCHQVDGIEIDPLAHGEGLSVLRANSKVQSTYLLGSAFDAAIVSGLEPGGYDLVVTNPPYVRYQSQRVAAGQSAKLPSALEVRNGLRKCVEGVRTLDDEDRAAFLKLTEHYSGLSDLAVPSWLLCAALVRQGGTLAMVVPDAWLNRDYASVVQYMLLRWFQIEFIVEDEHAAWFPDAQVKTTLLVARRIHRRDSISNWRNETYARIVLPSSMASANSLVGRGSLAEKTHPDRAFAKLARHLLQGKSSVQPVEFGFQSSRLADVADAVRAKASRESWFRSLEPTMAHAATPSAIIPPNVAHLFPRDAIFTTLNDIGVNVGQGLRTGANEFFYVERLSEDLDGDRVRLSKLFGSEELVVPNGWVLPVVRKQADVEKQSLAVVPARLPGGVLALQRWEPIPGSRSVEAGLSEGLARHIKRAECTPVGAGGKQKLLPSLTAVAPNARAANPKTGAPQRYWYMLPTFAPRHSPDLFIARINSDRPRAVLNPGRTALVDANFSTMWLQDGALVSTEAVLAYLNSTFASAMFEHVGSVMGGGALKLEATHLTRFPVPEFSPATWSALSRLGSAVVEGTAAQQKKAISRIDAIVCCQIFGSNKAVAGLAAMTSTLRTRLAARQHRN